MQNMQKEAYNTITKLWNSECGAERLVDLCQGLLEGNVPDFKEGPCSRELNYTRKKVRKIKVK